MPSRKKEIDLCNLIRKSVQDEKNKGRAERWVQDVHIWVDVCVCSRIDGYVHINIMYMHTQRTFLEGAETTDTSCC